MIRSALLCVAALLVSVPLQAQTLVYTIQGSVTGTQNPTGIWAGVSIGDPITVVYTVDANAIGTGGSGDVTYGDSIVSASLDFGGVISSEVLSSSQVHVIDDDLQFQNCRDQLSMIASGSSEYSLVQVVLDETISPCCPDALTSTDLPTSLASADFNSFRVIQLVTGGGAGSVFGSLQSITVSGSLPPPPPVNDECSSPSVIGPGLSAFDTTSASTDGQPLNPALCDIGGDQQLYSDIWYSFTPPTTGDWHITTSGLAGFDTRLAVHDPSLFVPPTVVTYTIQGTVTSTQNPSGIWSGVQPGDPITLEYVLDPSIMGVGSPDNVLYSGAVLSAALSFGGVVSSAPLASSQARVIDDRSVFPECSDRFEITASGVSDYTYVQINLDETLDLCCPDVFSSSALPTALNPVEFSTNRSINLATGNASNFVFGDLQSVSISAPGLTCPANSLTVIACNDDESGAAPFEAGLTVSLLAGNEYIIRLGSTAAIGGGPGSLLVELVSGAIAESCYGDGGDQMGCTECPCTNNAAQGSLGGCLNSAGTSARLLPSGTPSVAADSLRFEVSDANVSTFGVLASADNLLPAMGLCPAGSGIQSLGLLDGLRCVGGALQRHGSRATDAGGDIGLTNNGWGPPNGPAGGLIAQGGFVAGQTRHYQCFYRELGTLVCMTGQNTTQAVSVTFEP